MSNQPPIIWLDDIDKNDREMVGIKAAYIGELSQAGFNVPPAFVLTTTTFDEFFKANKITPLVNKLLAKINLDDTKSVEKIGAEITEKILNSPFPKKLEEQIDQSYEILIEQMEENRVAIRGSALGGSSFNVAGEGSSALNISGSTNLKKHIKKVWASLYSSKAIYYRSAFGKSHFDLKMPVIIQAMIEPDTAGIMFTVDPISNAKNQIVIDAAWGLGQAVVSGALTPDRYTITKNPLKIHTRETVAQKWKLMRPNGKKKNAHIRIAPKNQRQQKLTDEQILSLAKIGKKVEQHYGFYQDIEWLIKDNEIFLVETRPVTTITNKITVLGEDQKSKLPTVALVAGNGASVGIASGAVRIIHSKNDLDEVKKGEILVAETTNPDYTPILGHVAGIITDTGSRNSHGAIIAREFGLPAIVGTGDATSILQDGQIVTIDGFSGKVYKGRIDLAHKDSAKNNLKKRGRDRYYKPPRTATKIYVNLANPAIATRVSKDPADGVGLLRAEFLIASMGQHPRLLLEEGKRDYYVHKLAAGIEKFARAFYPRPIIYRSSDFKSNEYRALKGGDKYEPKEENPMLGYRGALRYIHEPDLFEAELEAIQMVRHKKGYDNLSLMIPFARTTDELKVVRDMVAKTGLLSERKFKFWMMCEVPSNVILIEEFLEAGIDGVSIGSNDLTQLTLGIDRSSSHLEPFFNENNKAVKRSIGNVIKACHKYNKTISVCGNAASLYPEFTEFLIKKGVTSVSVNPDAIWDTRELVASIEKNLND